MIPETLWLPLWESLLREWSRPHSVLVGLAALVLLGCGVAVAYFTYNEAREWVASASWPKTEGKVVSAETKSSSEAVWTSVDYTYVVDGREYAGHDSVDGSGRWVAEVNSSEGNQARIVTVHYNPTNPKNSFLRGKGNLSRFLLWLNLWAVSAAAWWGSLELSRKLLKSSKPIQPTPQAVRCSHPVSYQVALQEDPAKPVVTTGWKCTQCGERI